MHGDTQVTPAHMRRLWAALGLYVIYFAIWWLANMRALITPWWVTDDLALSAGFDLLHAFKNGRPLAIPFYYLLSLESGPYGAAINVTGRIVQGALHAAGALIIANVLARRANTRFAYVASAIFLLYPFTGEAILWRSAGIIPVAMLLSLLGFLSAERGVHAPYVNWLLAGSLLVTGSVLIHQLGGAAAIVLWCLVLLVDQKPATQANLRLGLWLGAGYLLGAALSILSTKLMVHGLMPRGGISFDLHVKAPYAFDLVRRMVWDSYRTPMTILQAALVLCALLAVASQLFRHEARLIDRWVRLAAWAILFFAPFGPMLISGENPRSDRMFYFAPLIFVGSVLAIDALVRTHHLARWTLVGATMLLLALYLPVARANSAAFVTLFSRDVASVHSAETTALRQNNGNPIRFVYVNPDDYIRSWDVQEIRVGLPRSAVDEFSDSKLSAFQVPWAFGPLVTRFTGQTVTTEKQYALQCATTCNAQALKAPFAIFPLADGAISCVCP